MFNEIIMVLIMLVLVSFFGYLTWDAYKDVKASEDKFKS